MMHGVMMPSESFVRALNCLQTSMMLTPCWPRAGPTGGAGLAAPAGTCSLIRVRTFLATPALDLLDLVEADLDWRLAAEDRHQHLELGGVLVDLGDLAGEVGQRPGDDLDALTDLELGAGAGPLGRLAAQQAIDLLLAQRYGLVLGPDETG